MMMVLFGGRRGRRTHVVSPLQTKGLFTLWLLCLAKSVAFVNAKTWSPSDFTKSGQQGRWFFEQRKSSESNSSPPPVYEAHRECSAHVDGAFPAPTLAVKTGPSKSPSFSRFMQRLSRTNPKIYYPEDCCSTCARCLEPKAAEVLGCPRGGHLEHHHHHHHHHAAETLVNAAAEAVAASTTPYGIHLNIWKVIFQALLTALNVVCWLVPLRSKKMSENKLALSLANAFSGGVFLSLAFGHLIPECIHGFADDTAKWSETTPFLLVLAGYLLIFFVEKVAFDAHEIMHEMERGGGGHGHDHNHHHGHSHSHTTHDGSAVMNGHSHKEGTVASQPAVVNPMGSGRSAIILLGALGVHSILEMMALGLADSFGDIALLTMSIALHQPAESIALLVAFLKSGMSKGQIVRYLSIFSCMGPIGVALGMAVNEFAAPIVDSIMLAVVAGTFVYVGATEVIPEEWEDSTHKWKKFAALMSGIGIIVAITQYTMSLGAHAH